MSDQVLTPQASLELTVWVTLLRGYAGLTGDLSARLQEEHELTINDYEVLLLLSHAEEGRMRRVDLADKVMLSPSGVTRLLEGLQKQGFVKRDACAEDGRVAYAVLTDRGRAKLGQASDSHLEAIRRALGDLYDDRELKTFGELLSRLPGAGGEDPRLCSPGDG
jgi:DNA-binding MarR family transcriptional regulator